MSWAVLGGSLAAVLALAGIAWLLRLGGPGAIDGIETAFALARDAHAGFAPEEAAIDAQGRAALVRGADGTIVLLRAHGAQFAARVFHAPPRATRDGPRLIIATAERIYGDATLDLGEAEAARWASLLESANG